MKYIIFESHKEALDALAEINKELYYPRAGITEDGTMTWSEYWKAPLRTIDGRYALPATPEVESLDTFLIVDELPMPKEI